MSYFSGAPRFVTPFFWKPFFPSPSTRNLLKFNTLQFNITFHNKQILYNYLIPPNHNNVFLVTYLYLILSSIDSSQTSKFPYPNSRPISIYAILRQNCHTSKQTIKNHHNLHIINILQLHQTQFLTHLQYNNSSYKTYFQNNIQNHYTWLQIPTPSLSSSQNRSCPQINTQISWRLIKWHKEIFTSWKDLPRYWKPFSSL